MVFVNNAASILGLVALLVAAVAVAYSALNRTTIATLKESNAAQAERIRILEDESIREKSENKHLKTENAVLRGVVTGAEQLAAIRAELAQHHLDATAWWTTATESLTAIRDTLEHP